MASVETHQRIVKGKPANVYVARWRDPSGRSRKKSFARKGEAERHLTGIESAKLSGTYVDAARSAVRLGEWADQWLAGQVQLKASTRARYEGLLRVQILPTWGRVPLSSIGHADVAVWVATLTTSGLSGSTVRQAHRVLSLVLALAVRDGRLKRNPAEGVSLPRAAKPSKRFLTHEQVGALAGACEPYGLVVQVLAYCGLRYGELAALRVRDLDLLRGRLRIERALTEVGGRVVLGTPKTHQQRSVPVPRSLVQALADQCVGKGPEDLVFTSPRGEVLRLMNFRRRYFDSAATRAGLTGLTPHELRHTAASLAVSAGANVKSVQRMLGHASAAMTLDVYAGLFDDELDAVAARLDDRVVPPVCPSGAVVSLEDRRATS